MKIGALKLPNVKPQHSWILPLISLFGWWAMLVALMICWFAKGRPILDTDHTEMPHYIVYLSNIAATDLQPIFIVGSAIMGIFFVWAVIEDYYLRTPEKNYFPPVFHWFVRFVHAVAIATCIIGSLCILMTSCLKDNWRYSRPHSVFVILFVIFVFVYLVCHAITFILYYRHYKIRYFLWSAIAKIVWTCVAIVLVVCYGAFMGKADSEGDDSLYWGYSAVMEWTLVYFYGTMMFLIAFDLRRANYGDYVEYYVNREADLSKLEHDDDEEEADATADVDMSGFEDTTAVMTNEDLEQQKQQLEQPESPLKKKFRKFL